MKLSSLVSLALLVLLCSEINRSQHLGSFGPLAPSSDTVFPLINPHIPTGFLFIAKILTALTH